MLLLLFNSQLNSGALLNEHRQRGHPGTLAKHSSLCQRDLGDNSASPSELHV